MKKIFTCLLIVYSFQQSNAQTSLASFASLKTSFSLLSNNNIAFNDSAVAEKDPVAEIPATIPAFYAKRNNKVVELMWQPATEENKSVFIIQRKTTGEWETIAYVPCSATSENDLPSVYSYAEVNSFPGITQYRMKEVVDQTHTRPSKIIEVTSGTLKPFTAIYRNGKINLTFKTNDVRDVKVFSEKGKLLWEVNDVHGKNVKIPMCAEGMLNLVVREHSSGDVSAQKVFIK